MRLWCFEIWGGFFIIIFLLLLKKKKWPKLKAHVVMKIKCHDKITKKNFLPSFLGLVVIFFFCFMLREKKKKKKKKKVLITHSCDENYIHTYIL